ncbi:AMP-binding protein [Streptomyces bathyalis]|uniref:AMP-binding protein n=1 Tax=Streptomyces bathyalis TaxID=2710756 RepID=UPI003CCDAD43
MTTDPEDLAVLPYSSGTTELPKGVMLKVRQVDSLSPRCRVRPAARSAAGNCEVRWRTEPPLVFRPLIVMCPGPGASERGGNSVGLDAPSA